MRFSIKRENFRNAISKVERILSKQPSLPILANILIKTDKNRLIIASTNLEIAIKNHVRAKINKEGGITIPVRVINGFLSNIKDEVVEGETIKDEFQIKTEKHKIKIKGMSQDDYPIIPKNPKENYINMEAFNLIENISNILISVAHNDTRQELNGVNVLFEKNKIILASTDGYRLSEVIINLEEDKLNEEYFIFIENTPSIIIPALTFSEIQKNLTEGMINLIIKQNQLFIGDDSTKIISKLINGNYIDYKQILPKEYSIEVRVNRSELLNALKIAALISRDNNGEIKISSLKNKKEIEITSFSGEAGENISKITAEVLGGDFKILFNCNYLIDGLGVIKEDVVVLKLNQEKSPALIKGINKKGKENNNFSYVIMPIIKD